MALVLSLLFLLRVLAWCSKAGEVFSKKDDKNSKPGQGGQRGGGGGRGGQHSFGGAGRTEWQV
jgi:hypothetical protein